MTKWQYTKGLHDLGRGCFAYLQPDGSWGWSNAGLVADGDQTLLVDTLFDLPLTAEMLATMRDAVPAARISASSSTPMPTATTRSGISWWTGAEIIACRACAEEYAEAPPEAFAARAAVMAGSPARAARSFTKLWAAAFDWRGLVNTPPTTLFDQTMEVTVGNKRLVLTHLGLGAHPR